MAGVSEARLYDGPAQVRELVHKTNALKYLQKNTEKMSLMKFYFYFGKVAC